MRLSRRAQRACSTKLAAFTGATPEHALISHYSFAMAISQSDFCSAERRQEAQAAQDFGSSQRMLTRSLSCTNVTAGLHHVVCPVRQPAASSCTCRRLAKPVRRSRNRPNLLVQAASRFCKAVQATAQPEALQQVSEYFVLFKASLDLMCS